MSNDHLELKVNNIIRMLRVNVTPDHRKEFVNWYNSEHEHMLLKVPGVIWTYRGLRLIESGPEYFFMYLINNLNVLISAYYKAASETEWAKDIRPFLKSFNAENFETIKGGQVPTRFKPGSIVRVFHLVGELKMASELRNIIVDQYIPVFRNTENASAIWQAHKVSKETYEIATINFLSHNEYLSFSGIESFKSNVPGVIDCFCDDFRIRL